MAEIDTKGIRKGTVSGREAAKIEDTFIDLGTKLRKFKGAFAEEFTERLTKKYHTDVQLVEGYAQKGYITGDLSRSWGIQFKAEGVDIYSTSPYSSFVEYGVPPHTRTSAWGKPTDPYIHPGFPPQGQLRTTVKESNDICFEVSKKLGLVK